MPEPGLRVTLEFPNGAEKRTGLYALPEVGDEIETVDDDRRVVTFEVEAVVLCTFPLNSNSPAVARIRLRE